MSHSQPIIIQGGMGVAVSAWHLAREVAQRGQLGVVSGTALDGVLARRLQDGDPGGHMRRALAAFPSPAIRAPDIAVGCGWVIGVWLVVSGGGWVASAPETRYNC